MKQNLRIFPLESDLKNLSDLLVFHEYDGQNNIDFKPYLVHKPWGYEYLFLETQHSAIWALYLTQNSSTSFHCHPNKKTALIVLDGKVNCETFTGDHILTRGDVIHLQAQVFHKTKAISEFAWVLEIESPVDKSDLIRLADNYGRESKGYESKKTYTELSERPELLQINDYISNALFQNIEFSFSDKDTTLPEKLDQNELLAIISSNSKYLINKNNFVCNPSGDVFNSETYLKNINPIEKLENMEVLKLKFL